MSQHLCALIFLTAWSPVDGQVVENTFVIVFFDATAGDSISTADGTDGQASSVNSGGVVRHYSAVAVPELSTIVLLGIVTLALLIYCVYDSSCPLCGRRSSPREGGTV